MRKSYLTLATFLFIFFTFNLHATHFWEGDVNYSWNNAGNWDMGTVPGAGDDVIIPSGTPYACWVASTDQQCHNLFVMGNASLRVYDEQLEVFGIMQIYGTLIMDHVDGIIWAYNDVTWFSGSSANISAWAPIKVYGNWEFRSGANVHLNNGFVEFLGTSPCNITCKSTNSYFNTLQLSYAHDVTFNSTSTAPLVINNQLIVSTNADFVSSSSQDIVVNGLLNLAGGDLHFNNGNFIYNGPTTNVSLYNDYFYNLTVNTSGTLNFISTLYIYNDLVINGGILETDNVQIYGDWTNNVGPSAYNEATGEVQFKGGAIQICSSEIFYKLGIDKPNYYLVVGYQATIQVTNDLNVYDGQLRMNSAADLDLDGFVYIWNGASISADGLWDPVIYLSGGALHDYNTTNSGLIPGNATIEFDYNGSYFNLYSDAPNFNMNNVNMTGSGYVRFQGNINIYGTVSITNGGWNDIADLGFEHTIYGDIWVGPNGYFKDLNDIYFGNTSYQTFDATDNSVIMGNIFITGSKNAGKDPKDISVYFEADFHGSSFFTGNITLENGTLRLGDHHVRAEGNININDGGRLILYDGSSLRIYQNHTLSVNSGGRFESYGTAENYAGTALHGTTGYFSFEVNSGGTIASRFTAFQGMDLNGINVKSGGLVDLNYPFDYCIFYYAQSGGTLLTINSSQDFTVANAQFPENTWGSAYNVSRSSATGTITFSHALGDFAGEAFDNDPNGNVVWSNNPTFVSAKVFLEGPFSGSSMNTDLNAVLPLSQPYSGPPWDYDGTESVPSIPSASIVDWVLLELRTNEYYGAGATTWKSAIAKHAAFLLDDGTIVEPDGSTDLPFMAAVGASDNVYLVVWHRNHLGILSAWSLPYADGVYNYDFSTSEDQVWGGTAGHKNLGGGIWGMTAGDGNADEIIDADDESNAWQPNAGKSGYYSGDFDMDMKLDNKDKNDTWWPNIGRTCQVPYY